MITLGVGLNIQAEVKIKQKYPGCTDYVAIDPTPEVNKDLVMAAGGRFLQRTVGATDGNSSAFIMNATNVYGWVDVPHTSLQTVIKEANMTNGIDILMMDIEGAEFKILESFIDHSPNDTTICQFNVEIHNPFKKFPIIDTLYKLSAKRRYLLFNTDVLQIGRTIFNRCFFINVESPYCVKKYYPTVQ